VGATVAVVRVGLGEGRRLLAAPGRLFYCSQDVNLKLPEKPLPASVPNLNQTEVGFFGCQWPPPFKRYLRFILGSLFAMRCLAPRGLGQESRAPGHWQVARGIRLLQ
jgi:hypothetical protein